MVAASKPAHSKQASANNPPRSPPHTHVPLVAARCGVHKMDGARVGAAQLRVEHQRVHCFRLLWSASNGDGGLARDVGQVRLHRKRDGHFGC
jgi:hypothetical protein